MKVIKFGGSSVASANTIKQVRAIVESKSDTPVIVVVSALGGITDQLLSTAHLAADGNVAYEKEILSLINRHESVVNDLFDDTKNRMQLSMQMKKLLDELINIFKGVYLIKDLSSKTLDTIVSYGERLSSLIVSASIPKAKWVDSRDIIKTEFKHGKHVPNS